MPDGMGVKAVSRPCARARGARRLRTRPPDNLEIQMTIAQMQKKLDSYHKARMALPPEPLKEPDLTGWRKPGTRRVVPRPYAKVWAKK